VNVAWIGNLGTGTSSYTKYSRDHSILADGKPTIPGSSDPAFRGDPERWNPEELLVAALSACHKLAYLHLCVKAGIVVVGYADRATGVMVETPDGGHFTAVTLHPQVTIDSGDAKKAMDLHEDAHHSCFIAASVNFPVDCKATILKA